MPTLVLPLAGSRVMTSGIVMNGPASCGQHVSTGSSPRSTASPVATTSWHGADLTVFGNTAASSVTFGSARSLSSRPSGGPRVEEEVEPLVPLLPRADPQRLAHPLARRERVDRHREARALDVLEQQRGSAALHGAVGDFRDLETRRHRRADADEVAVLLERAEKFAEAAVGHRGV
jgi:hypothetical protein